jgi:hypothetical protein
LADVKVALGIFIPTALLIVGIARLRQYSINPSSRYVTHVLILMGLAKALLYPTDRLLDPRILQLIGVANVCVLAAMIFATAACIELAGFARYAAGHNDPLGLRILLAASTAAIMICMFLLSPAAGTDSEYLTRDFPAVGPLLAYWAIFLSAIASSSATICYFCANAWLLVRHGPLSRALAGYTAAGGLGVLYCIWKVVDLTVSAHVHQWHEHRVIWVSYLMVLAPLAAMGFAGSQYLLSAIPERAHRYQAIRKHAAHWRELADGGDNRAILSPNLIPRQTRRAAWVASSDPVSAHRLMIELADGRQEALYDPTQK